MEFPGQGSQGAERDHVSGFDRLDEGPDVIEAGLGDGGFNGIGFDAKGSSNPLNRVAELALWDGQFYAQDGP